MKVCQIRRSDSIGYADEETENLIEGAVGIWIDNIFWCSERFISVYICSQTNTYSLLKDYGGCPLAYELDLLKAHEKEVRSIVKAEIREVLFD